MLRKILAALLACGLGAAMSHAAERVDIGFVVDGPWERNNDILEMTRAEIETLTRGEFDVRFPEAATLVGDWTVASAESNLRRLLDDPEVDLIILWGVLASHVSCCGAERTKPIVAPVILDGVLQGIPFEDGVSGADNLSYVALPDTTATELATFRQIVPFDRIAILSNVSLLEAIPAIEGLTQRTLAPLGIDVAYVPVGASAAEALGLVPEDVDAVYVWPLFHMTRDEHQALVDGLNDRKLPTFSALGGSEFEAGMLATSVSPDFFPRLIRRVALNTQRILLGEPASQIPVAFSVSQELVINMRTARRIGVSPRWEVMIEARLLHGGDADVEEEIELGTAVSQAVAANLELAVEERRVSAGSQDVARARSLFRPRLDATLSELLVNEERAVPGVQAERTTGLGLSLSQLLYSDAARTNLAVQRELQLSREQDFEALSLDIAQAAAVAYFNVLRTHTVVDIQRSNVEVTRSNLRLAENRRQVGTARQSEVLRWRSQIATDRRALVEAIAAHETAKIELNRLLHRALEFPFRTREVGLDDPVLITGEERFRGYIETPRQFEVFRDFAVAQGLERAPELVRLRASIRAQRRTLTAARRSFWAPELVLSGQADETLDRGGAASTAPPGSPFENTAWSVGLFVSLPLWQGGERQADRVQAGEELQRLQRLHDATAERIEQRIRSSMLIARSSYTGIGLSRQAADSAAENLDLVADAYARGAVPIVDLLDAQTARLNAELGAANAVYDFFIDLMEVQRAVNRFDFFVTPEGRELWYQRLDAFFEQAGVERFAP